MGYDQHNRKRLVSKLLRGNRKRRSILEVQPTFNWKRFNGSFIRTNDKDNFDVRTDKRQAVPVELESSKNALQLHQKCEKVAMCIQLIPSVQDIQTLTRPS